MITDGVNAMIKRKGFVSNSSSSSFIIGYGLIKDRQKFVICFFSIKDLIYFLL